jgi:hypothetical protein
MNITKFGLRGLAATALLVMATVAAPVWADGMNDPQPAGAILDLSGTPIPGGGNDTYQMYTVDFTAVLADTDITFAFREDPAFISFSDASLVDLTTSSGNLLVDGDFSAGTVDSDTPPGWSYANVYGAEAGGVVESGCGVGSGGTYGTGNCWFDGAVQAYDAIDQTVATTVGQTYQITFWVADNSRCDTNGGPPCDFSDVSTNGDTTDTGGNGINVAVYAQAGIPAPGGGTSVPEPSSFVLLGAGLAGLLVLSSTKLLKSLNQA